MTQSAKPFDKPALRNGLILLWLISMPMLALIYLRVTPSPDQRQFDYMGWMALHGAPFYSGSFDMNWPGAMILHEVAIWLFGPQPWAWHLLDFIMMEGICIGVAVFLWRSSFRLAPFLALLFYPPLYVTAGGWMAGQRDIIAVGLLVVGSAAMLAHGGRELRSIFLAGVLVAIATLVRPTFLSVLAGLVILELLSRRWIGWPRRSSTLARVAALLGGFGLVAAGAVLAGAWVGNLGAFYTASFVFTREVYAGSAAHDMIGTVLTLFFAWWHWMTFCGSIGLVLWLVRDRRLSYPVMLVLGLAAAIALSYIVQQKAFGYHLAGFLLLLVMLTMVAVERAAAFCNSDTRWVRATGLTAALVMALLVVTGTGSKIAGQLHGLGLTRHGLLAFQDIYPKRQREIIGLIRHDSGPKDRIVLYGTDYEIPYLAHRLPAYRFITPAAGLMTPKFSLYREWMAEITSGLRMHRPRFILLMVNAKGNAGAGDTVDVRGKPILGAILDYLSTGGYKVAMKGPFGTLYERVAG